MTEQKKTPKDDTTDLLAPSEVLNSLTGYEEASIEEHFQAEILEMSGLKRLRAMAFVLHSRTGAEEKEAKKTVMRMTQRELMALYADEAEDGDDEDPESEQGKGANASD